MDNAWTAFGNSANNAFFYVVDKIIDMQSFFIEQAKSIGAVVLLIAILSAGLNYALTGQGLKENTIKILKATLFFLIVVFAYPNIIGFISKWTFDMAKGSLYPSVRTYFEAVTEEIRAGSYRSLTIKVVDKVVKEDQTALFDEMAVDRRTPQMNYTAVAPANVIKIIFLIAGECFEYANKDYGVLGNLDLGKKIINGIKGVFIGFFVIFTGIFALLEYLVCFLEFMLVSSVGVILLPLSIWEGSKFATEGFIKAIIGFFMKLLLCNIAIFLLIYGFISLTRVTSSQGGFNGETGQIVFILFACLLFLYICKSAPGIAQSLLTGAPSLSASGAISAAAGAVAAVKFVSGIAGKAAGNVLGTASNAVVGTVGDIKEANAARNSVRDAGGDRKQQAGAFFDSLGRSAFDHVKTGAFGLTRSLMGGDKGTNPHSWKQDFLGIQGKEGNQSFHEHFDKRRAEGAERGSNYATQLGLTPKAAASTTAAPAAGTPSGVGGTQHDPTPKAAAPSAEAPSGGNAPAPSGGGVSPGASGGAAPAEKSASDSKPAPAAPLAVWNGGGKAVWNGGAKS